ncbi:hypothetical protein F5884DRAFT_534125 [Xylogone sp. PMI_703]|nr:hypothetical protein F5884DRAFT_534125 [Xylogone sp. PMI_703]
MSLFCGFIFSLWLLFIAVLIMSSPVLPTPPGSQPSNVQGEAFLVIEGQCRDELAVRIEQQRAKIRQLELAAEERRRSDQLRIQERSQKAESRSQDIRQQWLSTVASTTEGGVLSYQQDEQRSKDRQTRDESAMQAFLRDEAIAKEKKEKREKRDQEAEERRLAKVKERELKQTLRDQRDQQRRVERQRRDEAAAQDLLRRKAVMEEARRAQDAGDQRLLEQQKLARLAERERKQLLRDQQDQQRRLDRQARDEACMQALLRYEAATKAKKAQEAEECRLAKVKEREQQWALRDQQTRQRRIEKEGRDEADAQYRADIEAKKRRDAERNRLLILRENELAEQQRIARLYLLEQRQLLARQQDDERRRAREARDRACLQAHERHEAAAKAKKAQEAEDRRLAKLRERAAAQARKAQEAEERRQARLREAEQKRVLREQRGELRREARRERDDAKIEAGLRRESAVQAREKEADVLRERVGKQRSERSLEVAQGQAVRSLQEEVHRQDRLRRDEAGRQALQRHKTALQAQESQHKSLTEGRIVAFDGVLPSFLDEEYQYMKQASTDFPEEITSDIQMGCMRDYQRAISDASRRLPCGICGGLFQEDDVVSIGLRDDDLQYFLQRTETAPDCCAVKDDMVSLCTTCNSVISKRAIPPLSAGNFVNCLFCQDYPEALKNLNTVEEAFIARAHVVGIFLKLTSGAKSRISYRGSRGHSVAVRQDPSELLKILPAARLRDYTTITVSWDRGAPPSEENLTRFCSVDKAKVVNALLWLCANNPVYKSVVVDYSVLDSWPDHHIPQEIRDAFITLGSEPGSTDAHVEDEREGYAISLQDGLFENELDAEVEDAEPGSILSRSFFSDLHGRDLHSTPATLASLQAILQEQDSDRSGPRGDDAVDFQDDEEGPPNDNCRLPHVSYKTTQHLPPMSAFTDPDYFTAAFPTLFPFGIGGHLGDANGDRPEEVSLKAFARYTMLHHSLL